MAEVTRLSGDFLTALEESSRNEAAVGGVFMENSSKLREVYAIYCRNHDSAAALLEKVGKWGERNSDSLVRCLYIVQTPISYEIGGLGGAS